MNCNPPVYQGRHYSSVFHDPVLLLIADFISFDKRGIDFQYEKN